MREWYFQSMGQELGPLSVAELKAKVDAGMIQPDTMVRRGVDGKWTYAERVKGLLPLRPDPGPDPVPIPRKKLGSSGTIPVVEQQEHGRSSPKPASSTQLPVFSIPLQGDDDDDWPKGPAVEFYDFVGFREAISPALFQAVRRHLTDHRLTMTQLNRKALAAFIARPELATDLMITTMSVIPQPANDKSNSDGTCPLGERERTEQATFRVSLFNCSDQALDLSQGELVPEAVDRRDYDEVGTRIMPPLDHKGHVSANVDGARATEAISFPLKLTIGPLAAANLTIWFRGTNKPSLTKMRGILRIHADAEIAISEPFTILIHGDSP